MSQYKFDRNREFITGYEFGCGHWRSVAPKALTERSERHGVQTISEPEIYHGAKFQLRADARTLSGAKGGCNNHYKFVLGAGAKAKSVPIFHKKSGKQLTFIVRVSTSILLFFSYD